MTIHDIAVQAPATLSHRDATGGEAPEHPAGDARGWCTITDRKWRPSPAETAAAGFGMLCATPQAARLGGGDDDGGCRIRHAVRHAGARTPCRSN